MMNKLFFSVCVVIAFYTPAVIAQVGPDITSWHQNTTLTGYGGYVSSKARQKHG